MNVIDIYQKRAVDYLDKRTANYTPEKACLMTQHFQLNYITDKSIDSGKLCMDRTVKSLKSLTKQYFYTLVHEMYRQSTQSQYLAMYVIGQYNPLTEMYKIRQTLQNTILFSNYNWKETQDNIYNEMKYIDDGATDQLTLLDQCDCRVIRHYSNLLRRNMCETLKC